MNWIWSAILEIVVILALMFPATYIVWILGGRKAKFGDFLIMYGEGIAWITVIVIVVTLSIVNTL